jgi:hypothetical protein
MEAPLLIPAIQDPVLSQGAFGKSHQAQNSPMSHVFDTIWLLM